MDTDNEEQCIEAVKSIAQSLDLPPIEDSDISTAHPLPRFKRDSPSKFIVKFTRRSVKNSIYNNKKKLQGMSAKDLPNLPSELQSSNKIYIGESLTQKRKKFFGEINNLRKKLRWKFIWSMNDKIYIRQDTNTTSHSFTT